MFLKARLRGLALLAVVVVIGSLLGWDDMTIKNTYMFIIVGLLVLALILRSRG